MEIVDHPSLFNDKKINFLPTLKLLSEEEMNYPNSMDGKWFLFREEKKYLLGSFYFGINEITDHTECYINIFMDGYTVVNKEKVSYVMNYINRIVDKESINLDIYRLEFKLLYEPLDSIPTELHELGFRKSFTIVDKVIKQDTDESHLYKELIIREYRNSDYENVLECLIESFLLTIRSEDLENKVDQDKLIKNIKNYYSPLSERNRYIKVAEVNSEFVGHITYEIIGNLAVLVDVYVLEEYRSKGYTRVLTQKMEEHCLDLGISKTEGTVDPLNSTVVLKYLFKDGWKSKSVSYLMNYEK
ncbi:GNAT family N-acetyltransferase [Virgibacillus pantothenticus]|uniref:GNAT family N-acetyltransferase n=1 Tax=Virgibacillus pantothenticus TaxID=1473 RepID=UPI000985E819|nr:GNAT family N-acetyltransferase [Virgibacillus pantothenticus]